MSAEAQANLELPSVKHMRTAFEQSTTRSTVRQTAFDAFAKVGFPTPRDEHWKYTNLRRLEAREFFITQSEATRVPRLDKPSNAYELVFVNGQYRGEVSTLPSSTGLHISSLATLEKTAPDKLEAILSLPVAHASSLVSLNTALATEGLCIEVASHTTIDKPLFINFISTDEPNNIMAHPRISIHVGEHSHITIVQKFVGYGSNVGFLNAVTTLKLDKSAQVHHCLIQQDNLQSFHINQLQAELAAHANLTNHHVNLGAALARTDIHVLLNGTEANVVLNGLQFSTDNQHHDTHLRVEHCVPHTKSNQDYRGIADKRGRIVFNGKVMVHEKAVKTDAQQSSRNLLLANTAEIDTKPELEIYNDDVKCAHGATVGQLDTTALFYLRSRGLDENQARSLLTHAFANHIIAKVPVPELQEQLTHLCHARFDTHMEPTA